jgi:hypothetical protein
MPHPFRHEFSWQGVRHQVPVAVELGPRFDADGGSGVAPALLREIPRVDPEALDREPNQLVLEKSRLTERDERFDPT